MNFKMKAFGLIMLTFSIFITGDLYAANRANSVVVDGDRISVYAEGMVLGELLTIVENMTGVQFWVDGLMAEKEIFVDFEGLPLPKGIRKILYSLNFAAVYDETGKLRKVVILGRGKDFSMGEPREIENSASESYRSSSPNAMMSTPRKSSHLSTRSKTYPSRKGPLQFPETPADKKMVEDGPPLNEPYSMEGPPNTENQISEGPQDVGSPDPPPPPAPDSKGSQVDGPPLDRAYGVDGPPDWGDQPMVGPPGTGSSKQ